MRRFLFLSFVYLLVGNFGFCFGFPNHGLPVISVVTDSANLWGPTGIYDHPDKTGDAWERECEVTYLENNIVKYTVHAGIRIQGGSSVGMPKKSFRLFFRSEYGSSKWQYPIFGMDKISKFDKLVLKSGYDDDLTTSTGTLLRDQLFLELWIASHGLPQQNKWVVLYLNNQYWGIYNVRENIDENFISDNVKFDKFDLVRFHNEGTELKNGSMDGWNDLYNSITTEDMSNNDNFLKVCDAMDMDNFLTLMALVQMSRYNSWGWGCSMYRNISPIEKWKFSIWDADRAFINKEWDGFDELSTQIYSYKWANSFYSHLLENDNFKRRLINAILDIQNTTFRIPFALGLLDSIYNIIKPEIPNELARWKPDSSAWESNVDTVRDFIQYRPSIVLKQMKQHFDIDTIFNSITIEPSIHGRIKVNTLIPDSLPWKGQYSPNNMIDIEAIPDSGYMFTGWSIENFGNNGHKTFYLTNDTSVYAIFEKDTTSKVNITNTYVTSVYPNPSKNRVFISSNNSNVNNIIYLIFTLDGKSVLKGTTNGSIDISSLNKGIYIVELIETNNGRSFGKILKE